MNTWALAILGAVMAALAVVAGLLAAVFSPNKPDDVMQRLLTVMFYGGVTMMVLGVGIAYGSRP